MTEQTSLSRLIKQTAKIIDLRIESQLKNYGVARSQYRVMYFVQRLGGEPTQAELSEVLDVRGPTLTSIVDMLVKKDWLSRTSDPNDRRVKRHRLTAAGNELMRQLPKPLKDIDHAILKSLTIQEVETLDRLLQKTFASLKERADA